MLEQHRLQERPGHNALLAARAQHQLQSSGAVFAAEQLDVGRVGAQYLADRDQAVGHLLRVRRRPGAEQERYRLAADLFGLGMELFVGVVAYRVANHHERILR
jgi:hypothetical protein